MIPEGWKLEPQKDMFNTIHITTPQGWVASVSSMDRNPAIILWRLALELLKEETNDPTVQDPTER